MSRNSVWEEFNINRLAVIQEDMCCRAFWRWATDESKSGGYKVKVHKIWLTVKPLH